MGIRWLGLVAAIAAAPLTAFGEEQAAAQDGVALTLEQRLEQAEQHIRVLERRLELADETSSATAKAAPVVKAAPAGITVAAADSSTVIKLRALLAVDARYFFDDATPATANTALLRVARPYIEGTVGNIYDFRLMPDFGGGRAIIQDAYVNARFKSWFALQAGKFKGPVGLERLQPDQWRRIIEGGFPTGLVPNRDIGVQLSGTVLNGTLSYAAGYFDGTVDGSSTDANSTPDIDNDGKRDWEGRIFALPFANSDAFALRGLGVGIGGSYVNSTGVATSAATGVTTASLLPTYRTPGQQTLFSYRGDTASTATINEATIADGIRRRLAPQFYYYLGRFGLMGEYTEVTQQVRRQLDETTVRHATLQHSAWELTAAWFLTGEEEGYAGFTQHSTFQPGKPGTGAWELVARYQAIRLDDAAFAGASASFANPDTAARSGNAVGVGVNWYFNQNFRWQVSYDVTRYDGGAATGDRPDEQVLLTRFGLAL